MGRVLTREIMNSRRHVLIAVPALNYTMSTSLVHLIAMSQKMNGVQDRFRFSFVTVEGVKGYDLVRNNIVQKFLAEPDYDLLWMIDDDIMPSPKAFGLLDVDADIVAPLMPTYKYNLENDQFTFQLSYAAGDFDDINDLSTSKDPDILSGEIVDVDMVGTGCTLIRREVLEDPRMHYDESELPEGDPPAVFRYHSKANGGYKCGEDLDFCVRARRLGYSIKLHTGIETGHLRFMDLAHIFRMKKHYLSVGVHSGATTSQPA